MATSSDFSFKRIRWYRLHLGFESRSEAAPSRTKNIREAREDIKRIFRADALSRWTDNRQKIFEVPDGVEHIPALARLLQEELNAGAKHPDQKEFLVDSEQPIVGIEKGSELTLTARKKGSVEGVGEDESGGLVVKPDGTRCYYDRHDVWMDEVDFPVQIRDIGVGDLPGGVSELWHNYIPDGVNLIFARLVYDCPYESLLDAAPTHPAPGGPRPGKKPRPPRK